MLGSSASSFSFVSDAFTSNWKCGAFSDKDNKFRQLALGVLASEALAVILGVAQLITFPV